MEGLRGKIRRCLIFFSRYSFFFFLYERLLLRCLCAHAL